MQKFCVVRGLGVTHGHRKHRYVVGLWKRPRPSRSHACWLAIKVYMGGDQHAFSTPSGRLALVNKAYTSIRPDGMVIDRSDGQYCNTILKFHDTHDTRWYFDDTSRSIRQIFSVLRFFNSGSCMLSRCWDSATCEIKQWHFSPLTITGQIQQVNWQLYSCIM